MTTLTTLDAEYADLLRVSASAIPANDASTLTSLAQSVDAGSTSIAAATTNVTRLAINTTDAALLSYQFFTGATPFKSGLDYLVSPTGPDPNNLNSAYYQSFNLENRFIDFAVNLGKLGEGAQHFATAYGALSLSDTLVQSYTTIFGFAPTAAQVSSLLNDQVPNGLGGTETRAQYFAYYGGDGLSGIGTKAALVGWLLAQAAKQDSGVYAQAEDAFLADLAPDGLARFHVDLVQAYGPQALSQTGATITFSPAQSVSLTSADPTLRSTNNADTITVTAGLNAGASVATGDGNDTLTITGVVTGSVTLGNGNDTATLGGLGSTASATPVLGAPPTQFGSATLGSGNDTVYLDGGTASGTTLSANGTNNVLHLAGSGGATYAGSITGFQTVYLDAVGSAAGIPSTGVLTIYDDMQSGSTANAGGGRDYLSEASGQVVVLQNTGDGLQLSGRDPSGLTLFLDHYQGAPTTQTNFSSFGAGVSPNGGAIVATVPAPTSGPSNATLNLHVSSDSTAGLITAYSTVSGALTYPSLFPNLVITGAGSLTAQLGVVTTGADADDYSFQNIDATGAGDLRVSFTVTYELSNTSVTPVFRLSNGTDTISVTYASASLYAAPILPQDFVFGSGTDTFAVVGSVASGGALANLYVTSSQTVFTPSEIDGFKKGVDHLVLDAVTTTLTAGVQAYVGSATTLTEALINISSHVAANTGAVFEFGGDTYVYEQDATVGVNTGDGLIRLVGVTGLSTAFGSGVGDIHVHG